MLFRSQPVKRDGCSRVRIAGAEVRFGCHESSTQAKGLAAHVGGNSVCELRRTLRPGIAGRQRSMPRPPCYPKPKKPAGLVPGSMPRAVIRRNKAIEQLGPANVRSPVGMLNEALRLSDVCLGPAQIRMRGSLWYYCSRLSPVPTVQACVARPRSRRFALRPYGT